MSKFTFRYGIDAPFWVFFSLGLGLVVSAASIFGLPQSILGLLFGLFSLLQGLWMFAYSTIIKIRHRQVILDLAGLERGSRVLDVGTGRGLLAIAAAKRGCQVIAIDKWSAKDLSGNGKEALEKNRRAEQAPPIEVMDGDVTSMPYEDRSFDAVVSNFVIHNIKSKEERGKAVEQMWWVLKPKGTLVISDIARIEEYTAILEGKETIGEVEVRKVHYTYPFSRIVVARKKF
ncbi:MAG: hypothetical protein K0R75_2052 [Paenibacillaceae bacterium]|nr:hypothetical protein [Paenibacillaceae bacterium]